MFCDLVGSTKLAAGLDPEDMLEILTAYHSAVAAAVERFGGYVARCHGDGILIYFGWPRANDTDAEQSVRAGLAAREAAGRCMAAGRPLRIRIGIATGVVVIGGITSPAGVQEEIVVGEAPNIASRLQTLAKPGTIMICHSTRVQLGGLFDCEDQGLLPIRGYIEPVRAWQARGESNVFNRFEALHPASPGNIIGRLAEIDQLQGHFALVRQGRGQVVLISGEAGIGKSNLVAALESQLKGHDYSRLQLFCAPQHQDSPLYPVIRHIEHVADFRYRDNAEQKAEKLRAMFPEPYAADDRFALLADLLSIGLDGRHYPELSPQRRREKTFALLQGRLEEIARKRPVLLVVEDMHWSDPTTIQLLESTVDRIRDHPILLVMTFRPDFLVRWAARDNVNLITLGRLDQQQSASLVAQTAGTRRIFPDLVERIVAQSDGVPFYIEELTKVALESPVLAGGGDAALAPIPLPPTLQASLTARLDRVPAAREIAQIGAAIGRQFPHALLAEVAGISEPELRLALDRLVAAELVFRRGEPPEAVYTFKHALVQDIAYKSLLKSACAEIHGRIVDALLKRLPDVEEPLPALLGYHCSHAGRIEQAATYYRRAGERSAERAALGETRAQLNRGLALAGSLPDSEARRTLEAELKLALGRVMFSECGNADIAAGKVFEDAVKLCRDLDRIELMCRALWGYWFNRVHRRELELGETAAFELLELGLKSANNACQIVAHAMIGITRLWQGRFTDARSSLQTARDLPRTDQYRALDLAIIAGNLDHHINIQLALTLTCLGHVEDAGTLARLAVEAGRKLTHLPSRAIIIAAKFRHDSFMRDDERLRRTAPELVELSQAQGFPFYLALGQCHIGALAVHDGDIEKGLDLLRRGLAGLQSTDASIWQPYFLSYMADALARAGQPGEALALADRALVLSAETRAAWFDAELHRLRGEFLLQLSPTDRTSGEVALRTALAIARRQSAKLWELRAANSLAKLWLVDGRASEGYALLEPVHAWFSGGPMFPDLADASQLLERLSERPIRAAGSGTALAS